MSSVNSFLQIHRFGDLDLSGFGLNLRSLRGHQSLSALSEFQLHFHFPDEKASELEHEKILGRPAVFSVDESAFFSGIISNYSVTGYDREGRCYLTAHMVPELWKLTEIHNSRRHAKAPVAILVGDMLKEYRLALEFDDDGIASFTDSHPPRSNPIQYDESVYNFLARHMQEESIFYYFQEKYEFQSGTANGQQTLVLGDSSDDFAGAGAGDEPPPIMHFQPTGNVLSSETVIQWQRQFRYRPGEWSISDYNYHNSRDFNMLKKAIGGTGEFVKFKRNAGFYNKNYGGHLQHRMDEAEQVRREFIHGSSISPRLFAGCVFELQGHPNPNENGRYVVTSIEHHGTIFESQRGNDSEYENAFTCVPANRIPVVCPQDISLASRSHSSPDRISLAGSVGAAYDSSTRYTETGTFNTAGGLSTPVGGSFTSDIRSPYLVAETAFVVDSQGRYEHDDEAAQGAESDPPTVGTVYTREKSIDNQLVNTGEVQVRFTWEDDALWADPQNAVHNRWLRVAQLMAGQQSGAKFLPRVGDEVVVLYIDGKEKKPLVIGSVYNNPFTVGNSQTPDVNMETLTYEELDFQNWKDLTPKLDKSGHEQHATPKTGETFPQAVPRLHESNVVGFQNKTVSATESPTRGNELLFKDTKDQEQIYIHAARDLNIDVEGNLNIEVAKNKCELIRGNYFQVVNFGDFPELDNPYNEGPGGAPAPPTNEQVDAAMALPANTGKTREEVTHALIEENRERVKFGDYSYPDGMAGPVAKSVVDGVDIAYDKVVGIKMVEYTGNDQDGSPIFLVKSETLADSEDRIVGDAKETRIGDTESHQYGQTKSYMYGNSWSFFIGAQEEITLGAMKLSFELQVLNIGFTFGTDIGYSFSLDFKGQDSFGISKNTLFRVDKDAVAMKARDAKIEKTQADIRDISLEMHMAQNSIFRAQLGLNEVKTRLDSSKIVLEQTKVKVGKHSVWLVTGGTYFL